MQTCSVKAREASSSIWAILRAKKCRLTTDSFYVELCSTGAQEKEKLSPRRVHADNMARIVLFCSNNCVQNQFAVTKWSRVAGYDLESSK